MRASHLAPELWLTSHRLAERCSSTLKAQLANGKCTHGHRVSRRAESGEQGTADAKKRDLDDATQSTPPPPGRVIWIVRRSMCVCVCCMRMGVV